MGMATPFVCEQEPAKNRRREPPRGCGEHLRHGHRASPQDTQDPTAGDNVLQDLPPRCNRTRQLETSSKLSSWMEVVLFSSDSGRPCPGHWGLVLPRCRRYLVLAPHPTQTASARSSMLPAGVGVERWIWFAPREEPPVTRISGFRGTVCLSAFVVMLHLALVRRQRAGANSGAALLLDLWLLCWSIASVASRKTSPNKHSAKAKAALMDPRGSTERIFSKLTL